MFHHIQLDQPPQPELARRDRVELVVVEPVDVPDVLDPVLGDPHVLAGHGGFDRAAAIVPRDDNVLDLENVDGVLKHCEHR